MTRKPVKRKRTAMNSRRPRNLLSIMTVSVIVVMLMIVVRIGSSKMELKKESYEKREAYLLEQIDAQAKRSEEIEEFGRYIQTKQYIEDVAKERLGLVYKDEIIFEANN